jgi:hypothetical protein
MAERESDIRVVPLSLGNARGGKADTLWYSF